jgi:hypothetical protein
VCWAAVDRNWCLQFSKHVDSSARLCPLLVLLQCLWLVTLLPSTRNVAE